MRSVFILATLLFIGFSKTCWATECDQYSVPGVELVDVGPDLEQFIWNHLVSIASGLNEQLDRLDSELKNFKGGLFRPTKKNLENKKKDFLSSRKFAEEVYNHLSGSNEIENHTEHWLHHYHFDGRPNIEFHVPAKDGVFGAVVLQRPLGYWITAPTMNVHGIYMGTDKFGHFFQQGYEYFQIYTEGMNRKDSVSEILKKAVELGVFQESVKYGYALTGIYSHSDLAANFAGFMFYLNLTQKITLMKQEFHPIFTVRHGRWVVPEPAELGFIKRLVTHHFDESLNPARVALGFEEILTLRIRARCGDWVKFYRTIYGTNFSRFKDEMLLWNGLEYGHSKKTSSMPSAWVECAQFLN